MTNITENVKISNIEEELSHLWEHYEQKNSIRASLFNLIVYASSDRRVKYLEDMAETIIEKFPCRIIFIKSEESLDNNHLNVSVSTVTSSKGDVLIACDRINIEAGHSMRQRVPFIVLPHLIPDLPVHLLWGQDPTTEDEILPHLQQYASRLIFDSDCAKDLQTFSGKLLEMLEKSSLEILDLNWAMLFGWREAISQTFANPEHLQQLGQANAIHIMYNAMKSEVVYHPEIRAVYLLCWLASQMNWQFKKIDKSAEMVKAVFSHENHDIQITLFPHENVNLSPGSTISVEIATSDNHFYSFTRKPKSAQIVIHISSAEACELPITLPMPDTKRGFAFMKELFYHVPSEPYQKMLKSLSLMNL